MVTGRGGSANRDDAVTSALTREATTQVRRACALAHGSAQATVKHLPGMSRLAACHLGDNSRDSACARRRHRSHRGTSHRLRRDACAQHLSEGAARNGARRSCFDAGTVAGSSPHRIPEQR